MAKETAEKKLLKLIETTQAQEAAATTPGAAVPASAAGSGSPAPVNEAQQVLNSVKGSGLALPPLALPPFLTKIFSIFRSGSATSAAPAGFGLNDINKILLVGIAVVFTVLFFNFLSGWNESQKDLSFSVDQMSGNMEAFAPQVRDLKDYLDTLNRRNIFQPYEAKAVQKEAAVTENAATPISDRIKDLKLVGISWLDTPESASAMIENTQSGVTYFLKSGEQINSVTVKQIYADSIIIRLGDEEMEMRL